MGKNKKGNGKEVDPFENTRREYPKPGKVITPDKIYKRSRNKKELTKEIEEYLIDEIEQMWDDIDKMKERNRL